MDAVGRRLPASAPATIAPARIAESQKIARQPNSPARKPPLINPQEPPTPAATLKVVIAAPPAGCARSVERSAAATSSETPVPCITRAGSSSAASPATAAPTEPPRSSPAPSAAVRRAPVRSTRIAAGRLAISRPAKKAEKTSPATVSEKPRSSCRTGSPGEIMSTHQKVSQKAAISST